MHDETKAITAGKNSTATSGTVNVPIYKTSTVVFPTMGDYDRASSGEPYYQTGGKVKYTDYSYGIFGTPTTFALQEAIQELEGGDQCLIFPSGLMAITMILSSLLKPGDHALIADSVYGPTRRFCNRQLREQKIEITYYDPQIGSKIESLIKTNTKLIFTESPGSLTFELQDIPAITKIAKKRGIKTVIDNSWATPLYYKPFEHGIDVSIQAGTKYIGGHSDILIGSATMTNEVFDKVIKTYVDYGVHTSPEDCYLALRGIRTMAARLAAHEKAALNVAKWLKTRKEVASVLHPALPSCPGHKLWKRDFKGSSGLFSIVLNKHYSEKAIAAFIDNMKVFNIGCSWGGYESLILLVHPENARTATKWEAKGQVIRLHIGLENEEDIKNDLEEGFKRLSKIK